jgi:hypothetical protein
VHIAILWSAQLMSYLVALLNVVFRPLPLLPVQPRRSPHVCARMAKEMVRISFFR